jgi:cation diffusion facilitator CzcD-associated flavoprotein CzcO
LGRVSGPTGIPALQGREEVNQTPSPAQARRHVIVIGAGVAGQAAAAELRAARISDFVILNEAPISSVFDDDTDTWALRTAAGEIFLGRVVVAADPPIYIPWVPEFTGRNDFRGVSFNAAQWDPDFDPAGKHIAVIGADATAGHYIRQLIESAASVTVFAHAPRRIVPELPLPTTRVKRWVRRHTRLAAHDGRPRPAATLVGSAIESMTTRGIHTSDGVDHPADAIIYGTGFAIRDQISAEALVGAGGLTIRQAWHDGTEPYFGVAVHGFPNYFFITGPDVGAQARYVVECLGVMKRTLSTRIEVRRSSQQVFNERVYVQPAQPVSRAFEAFGAPSRAGGAQQTYAGVATLTIAGTGHPVRVRLTGHLDPIDGHYHWQGTVFGSLPDEALKQTRAATVTVGERSASARIIEKTPWGTHSVAGVGAPPYALTNR